MKTINLQTEISAEGFTLSFSQAIDKLYKNLQNWLDDFIALLPNFIVAVLVIILFSILAKYISRIIYRILAKKISDLSIATISKKVSKIIIISIGIFLALVVMNLNTLLTSILTAAGILGLAIGLALQGTLANTFSGIAISVIPRIRVGDWIESNGYSGFVHDINLRSIVVRLANNNLVVIPNSKVLETPFINFSLTNRSRCIIQVGISYDSDLSFVKKLVIDNFSKKFPQVGIEEVEFFYHEFNDSSIDFTLRYWVDAENNKDFLQHTSDGIMLIDRLFKENNINIPFPIRTLDLPSHIKP